MKCMVQYGDPEHYMVAALKDGAGFPSDKLDQVEESVFGEVKITSLNFGSTKAEPAEDEAIYDGQVRTEYR